MTSLLGVSPVIPVVTLDDGDHAVPLARALARGGIRILEVTLRTPAALDAIERVAAEVPDMLVGAGTVTTPGDAEAAAKAGARFLVSPGSTPGLLDAMARTGLPFLPGVATVSEILGLLDRGISELKFFPAEAAGGPTSSPSPGLSPRPGSVPPAASPRTPRTNTWRCPTSAVSADPG